MDTETLREYRWLPTPNRRERYHVSARSGEPNRLIPMLARNPEVAYRQWPVCLEHMLQPAQSSPRLWKNSLTLTRYLLLALLVLGSLSNPSAAVLINFDNCLNPNVVNSKPLQLQFIPLHVSATFDTTAESHGLNVTVYGNVSGIATEQPYPLPDDPQWKDPNKTVGKIVDLSEPNDKYSTLFARFNVLSYTPYDAPASEFCNSTVHGQCPLGPAFTANS